MNFLNRTFGYKHQMCNIPNSIIHHPFVELPPLLMKFSKQFPHEFPNSVCTGRSSLTFDRLHWEKFSGTGISSLTDSKLPVNKLKNDNADILAAESWKHWRYMGAQHFKKWRCVVSNSYFFNIFDVKLSMDQTLMQVQRSRSTNGWRTLLKVLLGYAFVLCYVYF